MAMAPTHREKDQKRTQKVWSLKHTIKNTRNKLSNGEAQYDIWPPPPPPPARTPSRLSQKQNASPTPKRLRGGGQIKKGNDCDIETKAGGKTKN